MTHVEIFSDQMPTGVTEHEASVRWRNVTTKGKIIQVIVIIVEVVVVVVSVVAKRTPHNRIVPTYSVQNHRI